MRINRISIGIMQLSGWLLSFLQVKTMEGVLCKWGHVRGRSYALSHYHCHYHSGSFQHLSACPDDQHVVCSCVLYEALRKVGIPLDSAQSMDFTEFDPEGNRTHTCAVLAPRVRRVHLQWRRAWMSQSCHISRLTASCTARGVLWHVVACCGMLWHVVAPQAMRANSWKTASRAGARFSLRTGMPTRQDWWFKCLRICSQMTRMPEFWDFGASRRVNGTSTRCMAMAFWRIGHQIRESLFTRCFCQWVL